MKFSIITPVYNSYESMERYFDSLKSQRYKNFEVIFIDDCSTDSSYQKLVDYQEESELEVVVKKTKKNGGPGLARNIGLDFVTGDYVLFIDSDDFIDNNCLSLLNNIILETKADCVVFDFFKQKNEKDIHGSSIPGLNAGNISKNQALANVTSSMCGKTYNTEVIKMNNVKFPNLNRFEDMVFNKRAISKCNSIYYIKEPLYYYVFNKGSIVNSEENNRIEFAVSAFELLEKELRGDFPKAVETMFARELLYSTVVTLVTNRTESKEVLKYINDWEFKYPNWYKNQEIKRFSIHQKIVLLLIKKKWITGLKLVSYLIKKIK